MHPVTPLLKSWRVLAAVAVGLGQESLRNMVSQEGARSLVVGKSLPWFLLGTLAIVILGGAAAGVSWWFTSYRLTDQALEHVRGIVGRNHRSARLDRIQAVDVVQPLLARMIGLARLRVEVAGGGRSRIDLEYLTEAEAVDLRNLLLARAAGVIHEPGQAPEAPVGALFQMPTSRLVASILAGPEVIWLVVISAGTGVGIWFAGGNVAAASPALPALLGLFGVVWRQLNRGFAFEVAAAADGVRMRHGLLEQTYQTLPPGRVQAVRLHQPLTWRPWGWWSIDVNVAGYGSHADSSKTTETVLLPAGTRDEALAVLRLVWPELAGAEHSVAILDDALTGRGPGRGFTTSPRVARLLDPLGYRRNGYAVAGGALVIRRGALHRVVMIVPHERTQSVAVAQGPWQRRLSLASVAVHSTPGPVRPIVPHLGVREAAELVHTQSERARLARSVAGPERWISGDVLGRGHSLNQPAEAAEPARIEDLGQL
jgi:putative membrane protein